MALPRSPLRPQGSTRRRKVIGADPVSMDIGLERLLSQVGSMATTEDDFIRWKVSVVGRYEAHVEQQGIETARVADSQLMEQLRQLLHTVESIQTQIDKGGIREDHISVRGTTTLSKLKEQAAELITAVSEYAPLTPQIEKEVGYTRFQLGAVLLRNEFQSYEWMMKASKSMAKLKEGDHYLKTYLSNQKSTSDPTGLLTSSSILGSLIREIQRFGDVLVDMGLFEGLVQVYELAGYEMEPETMKTGKLVEVETSTEEDGSARMSFLLRTLNLSPVPNSRASTIVPPMGAKGNPSSFFNGNASISSLPFVLYEHSPIASGRGTVPNVRKARTTSMMPFVPLTKQESLSPTISKLETVCGQGKSTARLSLSPVPVAKVLSPKRILVDSSWILDRSQSLPQTPA